MDKSTFRLRRWEVSVSGFSESMRCIVLARTRGQAMADTWRSDISLSCSFGEYLKIARCRLDHCQPKPEAITVLGKPAWGLGHNGQYVQFVYPDGDHVLNAHPYDVLPVSARPERYQAHA